MAGFMFSFLSQCSHFKTLVLFGYISFVFRFEMKKTNKQTNEQKKSNNNKTPPKRSGF